LSPGTGLLRARDIVIGMEIARSARPDVILMRRRLRNPDGLDARLLLARDPATAHIPVIALGDADAPGDGPADLPTGFVGHLSQPLQSASFAQALGRAFQLQQPGRPYAAA
jgi:CheY-like chemotaxis protein